MEEDTLSQMQEKAQNMEREEMQFERNKAASALREEFVGKGMVNLSKEVIARTEIILRENAELAREHRDKNSANVREQVKELACGWYSKYEGAAHVMQFYWEHGTFKGVMKYFAALDEGGELAFQAFMASGFPMAPSKRMSKAEKRIHNYNRGVNAKSFLQSIPHLMGILFINHGVPKDMPCLTSWILGDPRYDLEACIAVFKKGNKALSDERMMKMAREKREEVEAYAQGTRERTLLYKAKLVDLGKVEMDKSYMKVSNEMKAERRVPAVFEVKEGKDDSVDLTSGGKEEWRAKISAGLSANLAKKKKVKDAFEKYLNDLEKRQSVTSKDISDGIATLKAIGKG
jgi:hypothetical protein